MGMRGREEEGMTQSRSKTASTGDISGVHTRAQESSVIPSALKGQVGFPPPPPSYSPWHPVHTGTSVGAAAPAT